MGIDDDDQHDDHDYYCDDNAKQNDDYDGSGGMVILFGKVKCVCYSIKVLHFNPFFFTNPNCNAFQIPISHFYFVKPKSKV